MAGGCQGKGGLGFLAKKKKTLDLESPIRTCHSRIGFPLSESALTLVASCQPTSFWAVLDSSEVEPPTAEVFWACDTPHPHRLSDDHYIVICSTIRNHLIPKNLSNHSTRGTLESIKKNIKISHHPSTPVSLASRLLVMYFTPMSRKCCTLPGLPAVAKIVAPTRWANCTATRPTPPVAAWISTRSPGLGARRNGEVRK